MKRYTVKRDGRYWSGNGAQRGFTAGAIGGCYSSSLIEARKLQSAQGGEVVEVVSLGNFRYAERKVD